MVEHESEAHILKSIKTRLQLYCREVVWVDRLQSGVARNDDRWIRMCKPGTPDLYAILRHNGGHLLFIEVKAAKGRQSPDQKQFESRVMGLDNIHYVLARSVTDVVEFIRNNITKEKGLLS
jgi:hypothetical protein